VEEQLIQARQLVSRLERLSADSTWARRASGYRASLLKAIDALDRARSCSQSYPVVAQDIEHLRQLIETGYRILDRAAREMIKGRKSLH